MILAWFGVALCMHGAPFKWIVTSIRISIALFLMILAGNDTIYAAHKLRNCFVSIFFHYEGDNTPWKHPELNRRSRVNFSWMTHVCRVDIAVRFVRTDIIKANIAAHRARKQDTRTTVFCTRGCEQTFTIYWGFAHICSPNICVQAIEIDVCVHMKIRIDMP